MSKSLRRVPAWLWIALYLITAMFVVFPETDLAVSRLLYTPGVGFKENGAPTERLIHGSLGFLLFIGNLGLIGLFLFDRFANRPRSRLTGKGLAFLLLFLALGPGLIVNVVLKENWGRARPVNVVQFGGDKEFTVAFVPSDQEGKSFTSGHTAASVYWILAVLLLAPRRSCLLGVAVAYSLLVSWMRLSAGGHFLSDIFASYLLMAILAIAMYEIIYMRGSSAT